MATAGGNIGSSNFICIPLKRTNEVDLSKPLKKFISITYSNSDNPVEDDGCTELNKLRSKAVCSTLDRHESSLDVLYRYCDQLLAIEAKLPITPTTNPIPFKWKDAFDKGSLFWGKASLTLSSGTFERACVLFNIAALQSQIGGNQNMDADDELKTAAKMYQLSAGVFNYLRESVMSMVQAEPTPDLLPDTLAALHAIMLAQAQEAIYLKAAKDAMKPGICAKIACQAADYYVDAGKYMNKEALKGLWEKEWISLVNGKQIAFLALAQYQQSLVNKERKEIGEELARLQEAYRRMTSGRTMFGSTNSSLFRTEGNAISKALELAKKDNDFIYHERIPDVKSLASIGKAPVAKALPPNHPLSSNFKDAFESLVPVAVHQALAQYDVRKTEIINGETGRMREATQLMNGVLASLNLPAALDDALQGGAVVPESVAQKASRVKSAGGVDSLRKMMNDLPGLLSRNREILDETTRLLNEEKEADGTLRQKFGAKWTRMPSEKLTEPLWAENGKYRTVLDTAANADGVVRQKFEANLRGMDLLSKSDSELEAAVPSAGAGGSQSSPAIRNLQELMSQTEVMKAKREDLEKDLKDQTFDISSAFLSALAQTGAVNEEAISTEKLNETYGPIREQVTASIAEQETLLGQVQAANAQFTAERSGGGKERETVLKILASSHDAFMELRSNLQEGTKFYNDLTPLLVRLQQKVSDFCFARKTEKDDLMKDLNKNNGGAAGGGGGDNTSSVPPPRPPPPSSSTSTAAPATPVPPPRASKAAAAPVTTSAAAAPSPYPPATNPFYAQAPQAAAAPPTAYGGNNVQQHPNNPYGVQPGAQQPGAAPPSQQQQQQQPYPPVQQPPYTMPYPQAHPHTMPYPYPTMPAGYPAPAGPPQGYPYPYPYPPTYPGQQPQHQPQHGQPYPPPQQYPQQAWGTYPGPAPNGQQQPPGQQPQ